jgi:hypothetical protein
MDWAALEDAIERSAWDDALVMAVEGWRENRSTSLADLVDLLATRTTVEPLSGARGGDAQAFQAAWLARANEPGPRDLRSFSPPSLARCP